MPFNGSGTFNRLYSWVIDAANSVNISSSRMDAELNGVAAALTNCITRDGQSPPSADIPWGGKRLTNLAAAAAGSDALSRDTADSRYILASGATNLTLSGALNAATGNFTGALVVNGALSVSSTVTFFGALGVNGTINTNQNVGLTSNATSLIFTDVSGSHPYFTCQNDNNFVFYGTDASGAARGIWSVGMRSGSSVVAFNGTPTAPTASLGDNSTKLATTAYVFAGFAALASPTFTGTPAAPTASAGTSTTQLATTAFVDRLRDVPRVTGGLARGSVFATSAGFTVNAANAGELYMAYNDSGSAVTVTQGTVTLRLHGSATTGSRTLAARGMCSIWYNGSGEAIISGDVS